jgi:hypothetical protein
MKNFFVLAVVGGNHLIGRVTEEDYEAWETNQKRLVLSNPVMVLLQAIEQDGQMAGYRMSMGPMVPYKTRQEKAVVDVMLLEILSEIETDPVSNNLCCKDNADMFSGYLGFVDQWRAEISGIVIPGRKKIVTSSNVVPFPKKR